MYDPKSTAGTDLKLGDGNITPGPETFASVDGISGLNGFGTQRSEIDVTTLKDQSKKFKLGLKDNGTLQVETFYDPDDAQHQSIRALNDTGDQANWQLILSDTAPHVKYSFAGYVSNWQLRADVDNVYKATFSIRISGDVVEGTDP